MKPGRVISALAAVAAGVLLGNATALAVSPEKGKQLFLKNGCWQCHGEWGQGGIAGRTLAPDPIPFDTLKTFVRTTSRAMPPYREQILSDDDLAEIYAYLQSIPKGPDPKTIPLFNQ